MIIYSIYKIVNRINGKCYIGFTKNPDSRFNIHKKVSKNSVHGNRMLYRAARKYGWENFSYEIIYQSKDGEHCLKVMESKFIQDYDSYKNGYNMTVGGEGRSGLFHSEETKYKIGSRTRGKSITDEHREKISKSHIGIKPSKETRLLMSVNRKGRRWYNDGTKNTQSKTHPGKGWVPGRIISHT